MAYTGKVTSAESLGRILQQARLLSGLSQRELAKRLGTTQKYIWELEAGKPSILMDRLFAAMRGEGGSGEVLGVQHDAAMGLALGQGPVGVAHGGERVGCGDGDVQVAGRGEGGQLG